MPVSGSREPPDHAVAPPLGGVFPGLIHSPAVVSRFHIVSPLVPIERSYVPSY